jgi:hypothetical protein
MAVDGGGLELVLGLVQTGALGHGCLLTDDGDIDGESD